MVSQGRHFISAHQLAWLVGQLNYPCMSLTVGPSATCLIGVSRVTSHDWLRNQRKNWSVSECGLASKDTDNQTNYRAMKRDVFD
jgi:hypothetical protein